MKSIRNILFSVLLAGLAVLVLYACGGESPTATPLPPTATPVPPTPTVAPTTAASAPTSSTSGGVTSNGGSASASDLQLIDEAITNTEKLQSYHFKIDLNQTDFITRPVHAEGDYVAPDKTYIKGTIGDQQVEEVIVGDTVYNKDASGNWQVVPTPQPSDNQAVINPEDIVSSGNPVNGIGTFLQAGGTYNNAGTDTVNGTSTQHYTFDIDTNKMMGDSAGQVQSQFGTMPSLGNGGVWIDPQNKQVDKVSMNVDMGPLMALLTAVFSQLGGTPGPGTPTPDLSSAPSMKVDLTMEISKQNDPSITVPTPPGASSSAPAATP